MKRIFLFLATNIAILLVLSIALRLLGIDRILHAESIGLDMGRLLVLAAVFGMGGLFISLALSKWTAKRLTGAQVIAEPRNAAEAAAGAGARASGGVAGPSAENCRPAPDRPASPAGPGSAARRECRPARVGAGGGGGARHPSGGGEPVSGVSRAAITAHLRAHDT